MPKVNMEGPKSLLILRLVIGLFLAAMFAKSILDISVGGDYHIYPMAGQHAIERSPNLYETRDPVRERKFFYPPSSAIFLIPLAWLPKLPGILLFSALKVACLWALLWGSIRYSGFDPAARRRSPALCC